MEKSVLIILTKNPKTETNFNPDGHPIPNRQLQNLMCYYPL